MIIVVANVVLKDGMKSKFLDISQPCILSTRKENGNISYNLLENTQADLEFSFLEEWQSEHDLELHMGTDHFKIFGEALDSLLAEPMTINVYEAGKLS